MLEARTQASVALFKLGAHSATLKPEFGGPEKFKVLLRKRGRTQGLYRFWLVRAPCVAGQSSPASQRSPDCHHTLASTTGRPRLSRPLPPAFRPQHQPLSGMRAAPARPPELADVIATQRTRHQAPRIRCLSLFGEGPGARPTAAPSHRAGLILFWDWRATAYLTHAYQNEYHSHTRREREFSPRVHVPSCIVLRKRRASAPGAWAPKARSPSSASP